MLLTRLSGPSLDGAGRKPRIEMIFGPRLAGQVEPMDAFFEEGVAAGHRFVVAPVVLGFQALDDAAEVAEDHVADEPSASNRRSLMASGL